MGERKGNSLLTGAERFFEMPAGETRTPSGLSHHLFHIIALRRAVFKSLMRRSKNSMYPDYNILGEKDVEPIFIINTP
jgi:hypothetical protein